MALLVMRSPEGSVQRIGAAQLAAQAYMIQRMNARLATEALFAALLEACADQQRQD